MKVDFITTTNVSCLMKKHWEIHYTNDLHVEKHTFQNIYISINRSL